MLPLWRDVHAIWNSPGIGRAGVFGAGYTQLEGMCPRRQGWAGIHQDVASASCCEEVDIRFSATVNRHCTDAVVRSFDSIKLDLCASEGNGYKLIGDVVPTVGVVEA